MDNLAARFSATALVEAVKSCASCAARPVCETGALAGWLGSHPANCSNVHRLRPTP